MISTINVATKLPILLQMPLAQSANVSRFPNILSMYKPHHYINENGTSIYEWGITVTEKELKTTAQMYYKRYNITAK